MYLAYDALSGGMKNLIDALHPIHTRPCEVDDPNSGRDGEQKKIIPPIAQPVGPPGDRTQGALFRREGVALRRHDAGREPAADRLPGEAGDAGRHHSLRQPLRHVHGAGSEHLYARVFEPADRTVCDTLLFGSGLCLELHLLPAGRDPARGLAGRGWRLIEPISCHHGLCAMLGFYRGEAFFLRRRRAARSI
jgi:hypothetical protein